MSNYLGPKGSRFLINYYEQGVLTLLLHSLEQCDLFRAKWYKSGGGFGRPESSGNTQNIQFLLRIAYAAIH